MYYIVDRLVFLVHCRVAPDSHKRSALFLFSELIFSSLFNVQKTYYLGALPLFSLPIISSIVHSACPICPELFSALIRKNVGTLSMVQTVEEEETPESQGK